MVSVSMNRVSPEEGSGGELEMFTICLLLQVSLGIALAVERKASATSRNSPIT